MPVATLYGGRPDLGLDRSSGIRSEDLWAPSSNSTRSGSSRARAAGHRIRAGSSRALSDLPNLIQELRPRPASSRERTSELHVGVLGLRLVLAVRSALGLALSEVVSWVVATESGP